MEWLLVFLVCLINVLSVSLPISVCWFFSDEVVLFRGRRRGYRVGRISDEEAPLILSRSVPSYPAWLGDALHKLDLRTKIGHVDGSFETELASNEAQKAYLLKWHPELCNNMDGRSLHSFGTLFEIHYWQERRFRNDYLRRTFPAQNKHL